MARGGEGGSDLGLLTFCRNDVSGVLQNVELLRQFLDEVVVVDSSSPAQRETLARALRPPRERWCAAPPLGVGDLLRPFGVARMQSERVLQLDSDEVLSKALLDSLPTLNDADAYVVPRWEAGARGFTYHMRLFRRRSVSYSGPSYGYPHVSGVTRILPRRLHIVHNAPVGRKYWEQGNRARRYLLPDLLERPYDGEYFRQALGLGSSLGTERPGSGRVRRFRELSGPAVRLVLVLEAARTLLASQSPGLARFRLEQGRQRIAMWNALSPEEKTWTTYVALQVSAAGGLIRYLGIDDPAYMDLLNESFDSATDGPELLRFLLRVRSEKGRPWHGDPPYPRAGQSWSSIDRDIDRIP